MLLSGGGGYESGMLRTLRSISSRSYDDQRPAFPPLHSRVLYDSVMETVHSHVSALHPRLFPLPAHYLTLKCLNNRAVEIS